MSKRQALAVWPTLEAGSRLRLDGWIVRPIPHLKSHAAKARSIGTAEGGSCQAFGRGSSAAFLRPPGAADGDAGGDGDATPPPS